MQELQLKESVANKTSTSHQEPKRSLVTSGDLSCSDNSQNPTDSQSQNTSENNQNNSSVISGKRPNDTANLNPAKRTSKNISTEKNENNLHHILGSNSHNHSTLFNRENFSGLSLFTTTPQTNTNPTLQTSTNNLSLLTTLFHLPSNQYTLGSTVARSPFLFGSSQSKPDDAVDNVATTKIKPQPTAILESIIKHKSFDTGKPRAKKAFCRFADLTTYQDEKFDYSANTIPNMPFHVGEGPMHSEEIIRFFINVLFNPKLANNPIECIVAAGHPNQGLNRYFAYFLQENGIMFEERDDFLNEKDYEDYEDHKKNEGDNDDDDSNNDDGDDDETNESNIGRLELKSTKISESEGGNIVYYKVRATLNRTQTKETTVLNLPKFCEFSSSPLTQNDIREFLKLYQDCKKNNKSFFIHCAAGRGRSCTLALAFILFENHDECYEPNGTPRHNVIAQKLRDLRDIRPGAVQTVEQLQMAIDMGHELKKVYDLDLQAQKDKSNNRDALIVRP